MAKTTKTTTPKSTSKSTAVKSATSSKSMKTTASRADVEKLDEVKLGAPTKTAAKAPAKKAVTANAKVSTTKTVAKAPAKTTAPKAATSPEKSMPTKSVPTKSVPTKSTTTVTAPARMAAKPTTSAKKSVAMPTIRLDTVRPELLMLAQKNGWLRSGLTLDVADAQLVYTADKWATLHTLPLASLDDSAKGFTLSGVPTDVEIEYVVKASLSLSKAGEKFEVPGSVWLNNRGHNYTTTVKSTAL